MGVKKKPALIYNLSSKEIEGNNSTIIIVFCHSHCSHHSMTRKTTRETFHYKGLANKKFLTKFF
jgi:hypothetical protein